MFTFQERSTILGTFGVRSGISDGSGRHRGRTGTVNQTGKNSRRCTSVIAILGYYRRYIPDFSRQARTLYDLLKPETDPKSVQKKGQRGKTIKGRSVGLESQSNLDWGASDRSR